MITPEKVPFLTPIESKEKYVSLLQYPAYYLWFGGDVARHIERIDAADGVRVAKKVHRDSSCVSSALKVASYVLSVGILPLLALVTLAVARHVYPFNYWTAVVPPAAGSEAIALSAVFSSPVSNTPSLSSFSMSSSSPIDRHERIFEREEKKDEKAVPDDTSGERDHPPISPKAVFSSPKPSANPPAIGRIAGA